MEWEKVQIAFETGDELEGKDVNMGVEGSNSNGHGKEKDKEGHIMKIIEGLQREAKARWADSQNLMKVRDRQGELKLNFFEELGENREENREGKSLKYDGESQNPWEKK